MAGTATVAFPASIGRNGALAATLRRSGATANRRIMPGRYAHGVMTGASPTAIRSPYGAPIWSGGFAVMQNATDAMRNDGTGGWGCLWAARFRFFAVFPTLLAAFR